MSATRMSTRGLAALVREEGVVRHAYDDPAGHCTVGVGHLLHLGRCGPADYAKYGTASSPRLTTEDAYALLRADLLRFEGAVRQAVRVPLHQSEFDALVSFAYNVGTGGMAGSQLVRDLNAGNRAGIHQDYRNWSYAGGRPILAGRREREWRMFTYGDYNDGGPFRRDPLPPPPPADPAKPPARIPAWAWKWVEWRMGRGPYKGHANDPRLRPSDAPARIPLWGWTFLKRFLPKS